MKGVITTCGCIVLFCVMLTAVEGSDWTKWRGPYGNGISPEKDWNPNAFDRGIKILWDINVGMGHSSAAVKGNRIYTMGNRRIIAGSDTNFVDIIWCVDAKTGREIWRYSYPCQEGLDPGPGSSPILDGSHLYTISREGHLYCFDAENGRIIWMRNVISDSLALDNGWGFSCSPVIDGNCLILNANESGIAFDKRTGKLLWNSGKAETWFSTAVLMNINQKRMAVFPTQDTVYAVNLETGKVHWSFPWGQNSCADPIIIGNKMMLTGPGNALLELSEDEPKVLWENKHSRSSFQSWVIVDDNAYGFGSQRRKEPFCCVDINTGELKWEQDIGNMGAVISANGKLIILTRSGRIIIAEATAEGYKEISNAQIVPMTDNTGINNRRQCHCWINPVLSDGRLYARNTFGNLVCVDLKN